MNLPDFLKICPDDARVTISYHRGGFQQEDFDVRELKALAGYTISNTPPPDMAKVEKIESLPTGWMVSKEK